MGEQELDSALVQRAKAGDKGAFDLLVRKYQHRIAAVVSRFVRDYGAIASFTHGCTVLP